MYVTLLGDFDQLYVLRALKQIQHKIAVPKQVHLYLVGDQKYFQTLEWQFPLAAQQTLHHYLSENNISFSYQHRRKQIIVLIIPPSKRFLLQDKQAFMGLLVHELLHLEQMRKGMYRSLQLSHTKVLKLYARLLTNLHQKQLFPLLERLGQQASLLLKDLYVNGAVIKRGFSHELLKYYEHEFSLKKVCPAPVFYDKLRRAVHRDPKILEIVFSFEFALLSVILPFKKYKERHAKQLLQDIAHCYNLNMKETLRKCGPFIDYYLDHYIKPTRDFQEKYFHLIFTKVLELLA